MVELDKPVTIANYVFILLSTMMTNIAFNHVILRGLVKEDTDISIPNKTIHDLYLLKIKIENFVSELQALIVKHNNITGTTNKDNLNKLKIKGEIGDKYLEYKTTLDDYTKKAKPNYKTIFKFKYDNKEYFLNEEFACYKQNSNLPDPTGFYETKVEELYKPFNPVDEGENTNPNQNPTSTNPQTGDGNAQTGDGNADTPQTGGGDGNGGESNDSKSNLGNFTNTSFEGFYEGKYQLTDDGEFKDKEYTENITNGSIAVYIFAVLISIAGFIYHTHAYHIMGAVINMVIASMGLHLWTLYHDKKDKLDELNKSYIQNIILASWVLCLLTFTVFIFVYLHNDDSSF
jgi:hypothetical protein